MKRLSDGFYRRLFLLSALWNVIPGLAGLLFYQSQFELLFGIKPITGDFHQALLFRSFMITVILFGIGYYIVSRELTLNRGIVWLGGLGKVICFVIFTVCFFIGKATLIAFMIFLGDFIWAILFALFLYQTRDKIRSSQICG